MMTRFSLLLALVSMLTLSAQAQVSIGASAGANYSLWQWHVNNINLDDTYDPGFGYRAAAVADWHISPLIGLRADIAYQIWRSSTDAVFSWPTPGPYNVDGNVTERFHNFSGSLLASISPFRQKRIYFLAGATAAHVTKAWYIVTLEDNGVEPGRTSTTPIDLKNYNRTQVFADFGGGVKFPSGQKAHFSGRHATNCR